LFLLFSGHHHGSEEGETCIHSQQYQKDHNIQEKKEVTDEEGGGTQHPLWH